MNPNSENTNPTLRAKAIAQFQNSGADAKQLVNLSYPIPDLRSIVSSQSSCKSSPSVKATNHQKNYRKTLQEIQRKNQRNVIDKQNKLEKERKKTLLRKQKQFGNVQSKVFASFSPDPMSPRSFTSSCSISTFSSMPTSSLEKDDNGDFPPMSIKLQNPTTPRRFITSGKPDPQRNLSSNEEVSQKHESYGKVPSYLLKRKEELNEKENERRMERASEHMESSKSKENNNGGMVRLSEAERVETLSLLQENEKKLRSELHRLPLAAQSLGTIKKRENLENKLNEIQEAKKIFSKDKVYVFEDKVS